MAHDIADLLSKEQLAFYAAVIRKEVDRQEDSRLVVQIMETNKTVSLTDVMKALKTISEVFTKRLSDDQS